MAFALDGRRQGSERSVSRIPPPPMIIEETDHIRFFRMHRGITPERV